MDHTELIDANYARILISPRATIRAIVDRDPRDRVIVLAVIGGVVGAIAAAVQFRSPEAFKIGAHSIPAISGATLRKIRLGRIFASPVLALIFLYLDGALLRWSGGLLGGTAKPVEVRAVVGWSSVPSILTGLILIAFTLIDPPATMPSGPAATFAALIREWPRLVLGAALGLYTFVISVKCLAEVHRFSAWRGLGAWLIERLLLFGAFIVLAIAVPLLAVLLFR
jgi:hypothetical protein